MILREVGGGGIIQQAHIKLLTTLPSEGPDLQKGLVSLAANLLQAEPWAQSLCHRLKVTLASLERFLLITSRATEHLVPRLVQLHQM